MTRHICYYGPIWNPPFPTTEVAKMVPEVDVMGWRTGWNNIEPHAPVDGVHTYYWDSLDYAIDAADKAGKLSTFRIIGGQNSPPWVQPTVTFTNAKSGKINTLPILWSNKYLNPFCALIKAACQRYGHDKRVAWIVMAGAAGGDEMVIGHSAPINVWQNPASPPAGCGANIFSPATFINAWNRCIDAYRHNLPATMPSCINFDMLGHWDPNDANPMYNGSEIPAILNHCETYRDLVYYQNNGMNNKFVTSPNGTNYEHMVYAVVYNNASFTTTGWQMQNDGHTYDHMETIIETCIGSRATYLELWPNDCMNKKLSPLYQEFLAA
jgi:hypothetical protein